MSEISRFWSGTTTGDAGPYSDSDFQHAWRQFAGGERANVGPLRMAAAMPNDTLEVTATSPASAGVTLKAGAALVEGVMYINDADLNLVIAANGSGNDRIDLVVLRKDYTLQTVRAAVVQGTPAGTPVPPALTQTVGVLYEIPIADVYAANGFSSISTDNITPRHEYAGTPDGVHLDGILNNSGVTLETGDVVIWDTSAARAVITTTTAGHPKAAGAWVGRTANGAYGRLLQGGIGWVKVGATVAIGDGLVTNSTIKQAIAGTTNRFGRALAARTGAGLVKALLYPVRAVGWTELLPMTVLGGSAASIDIQNIAALYTHLKLVMKLRTDRAGQVEDDVRVRFNNDATAANYYSVSANIAHSATLTTSEFLGATATGIQLLRGATGATAPASGFAHIEMLITDYASIRQRAVVWEGWMQRALTAGNQMRLLGGGQWQDLASAINRITIVPVNGTNFVANSAVALYGLGVAS